MIYLCGLYARVSTDRQAQIKDGSLDTQLDMLHKYVEIKDMGDEDEWKVVKTYREEGKSGKDTNRPEYQKMLKDIEQGVITVLLSTKIDRISRSLLDFYHLFEILAASDVTFISLNEQWDTSMPMGRFAMKIVLAGAELEREQTSERTKEKMHWRAEQGLSNGGRILGYDPDPENKGIPLVVEEEKALVNLIFETYLKEKSFRRVASAINAKGYRTKHYTSRRERVHGGTKFMDTHIGRVLQNPYYIGRVVHRGQIYDGQHEPIVSKELFDRVQKVIRANQIRQAKPRKQNKHLFLLQGLVRCGDCESYMTPYLVYNHQKKPYFYYTCTRSQHTGKHECQMGTVSAPALEDVIAKRLAQLTQDSSLVSGLVHNATGNASVRLQESTETRQRLSQHRASIEEQINTLVESLAQGEVQIKSVGQKIVELEERREQLSEEILELEQEITLTKMKVVSANSFQNRLTTFSELYAEALPEEKQELLMLHINRIIWTPQEIRLALFGSPTTSPDVLTTSAKVRRDALSGSGGRARTYDMVVNSHPLCQLSYAGSKSCSK